jgi:hypothetical protein
VRGVGPTRRAPVLAPEGTAGDPGTVTRAFTYGTAHSIVMVGAFNGDGMTPRQIGPAHATIGGRTRRALCGAWVGRDDDLPWPPEAVDGTQLCPECAELAAL